MVILYRTARPPVVYKARICSCAFLFHVLCLIVQYLLPVLACIFYVIDQSNIAFDTELPMVIPGNIIQFIAFDSNGNSINYPSDDFNYPLSIKKIPNYSGNKLSDWTMSINISDPNLNIISATVIFNYTVKIRRFANNTIKSIGTFTSSFPFPTNHISCSGILTFEQNEIPSFHGRFEETTFDPISFHSLSDLLEQQDNTSTLFYVDWTEPIVHFGKWHSFTIELKIKVTEIEMVHTIPLISSIESVIILYLSTLLFTSIVLNCVQGFVYRNGILKSWKIQKYLPTTPN